MINQLCEKCQKRIATQKHHIFSKPKKAGNPIRKIYGKLLDEPFNLQYLCYDCHHQKSLDKWNERQFRNAAEFRGYVLPEPSKSFQKVENIT